MASILSHHWITEYSIFEDENVKCSICEQVFRLFETIEPFKQHIITQHMEYYQNIIIEGNSNWLWSIFYVTDIPTVICSICNNTFYIRINELQSIRNHLTREHGYNYFRGISLCDWIKPYTRELKKQKKQCLLCFNIYEPINSYNLARHLINIHTAHPPPSIGISEE